MNLDSLSFALIHINNLVGNLTKKNCKASCQEIAQLVSVHGAEAQRQLLRCLCSHAPLSGDRPAASARDSPPLQLLQERGASLVSRLGSVHLLCQLVDHPNLRQKSRGERLLPELCRALRLSRPQEVALAIALLHSTHADTTQQAARFIQQRLPELIRDYIDSAGPGASSDDGGLQDSCPEVLHQIVSWLLYAPPEQLDKAADSQEGFLEAIRKDFPRELVPVVLAPLIYAESADIPIDKITNNASMEKNLLDGSLADFVLEVGYSLCTSVEECRRHLVTFGVSHVTAPAVARCLGAMVRTYTGLADQLPIQSLQTAGAAALWAADKPKNGPREWNVEVFVKAVHELVPAMEWKEVLYHLDYPGFQLKDRTAFSLLTRALREGLQLQGFRPHQFPVGVLYRAWKNADSQLSYISQILKHPDVFCLADYGGHMVDTSQLKMPPEKESRDINTWRVTELIQLLLHLAESGHSCAVQELLNGALQSCPDILALNLLAAGSSSHLAQELLSNLFLVFLAGHHPNSAAVLHQAWHAPHQPAAVRTMLMHTMAEWYRQAESDQGRLSRILDVAQDLKALSLLLSYQAMPFVIDLACLASRREYLKLDKWLSDKAQEHGEPFIAATIKFLQRRVPQLAGGAAALKDQQLSEPPLKVSLPADMVTTMLGVLHARAQNAGLSQELSDVLAAMVAAAGQLLQLGRPRPPPGVGVGVARPPPFSPSPLTTQLFPPSSVDSVAGGLSSLSVGGRTGSPSPALAGFTSPFTMLGAGGGGGVGLPPSSVGSVVRTGAAPGPLQLLGAGGGGAGLGPQTAPFGSPAAHPLAQRTSALSAELSLYQSEAAALSKEVEEEANSNFQRIYNHPPHPTLSIEEVLDMLKRFQDSSVPREREVFSCMLRSLMDEYKFFPQYPDKELYITAQLFGGIIEHNLVTNYMGLGLALRYVLDAVKKPPGSKMYYFGVVALDRFRGRLREYPQYCQHLATVEHFKQFPQHLMQYVECGIRSQEPPGRPEGPVLPAALQALLAPPPASAPVSSGPPPPVAAIPRPPSAVSSPVVTGGRPSIANTTNIDTLVKAMPDVPTPGEPVQDKVGFIFNNLSQLNLPQKCENLLEVMEREFWPWFAQYVVIRRVSIEPNFHQLYASFLDALRLPELTQRCVRELLRNIQVLMRADKGVEKFNDRTILKNLGHWLGLVTIAKNRPILQTDLDMKSLVIEAYHLGVQELLYVVPFVAKVLESCAKSKIFRPPNPWTLGMMNLLAELHQERDLKLNLKFEVEVLCKTLALDINELTPSQCLNNPLKLQRLPVQLKHQPSMAVPPPTPSQPPPMPPASQPPPMPPPQLPPASSAFGAVMTDEPPPPLGDPTGVPVPPRFSFSDISTSSIGGLAPHITVNLQLPLFQSSPSLRQLVRPAVERAVQDCLPRAVERNCKLAVQTAEQIVRKDFALDGDEQKLRTAAHQMVMSLTAGLTLINCRDHLAVSIATNIKAALLATVRAATLQQKEFMEQTAGRVAADNVELACCFIQKTAVEKAIIEVEKRLGAEYERRKAARADGRRFGDPQVAAYHESRMPPPLRLGPLSQQQTAVFEMFARAVPGFAVTGEATQPPPVLSAPAGMPPPPMGALSGAEEHGMAPSQQQQLAAIMDKLALELQGAVQNIHPAAAGAPPAQALARLAKDVALSCAARDISTHIHLVKVAVDGLLEYLSQGPGGADPELSLRCRDAHLLVLRALQDPRAHGAQWVQKHVTSFVIECREDLRLNLEAMDALIRARLVSTQQLDAHLAHALEAGNYSLLGLALQLLQAFLIDDRSSPVTENDFVNTLEALSKLTQQNGCPESIPNLLEAIRNGSGGGGGGGGVGVGHDTPFAPERSPGGPTAHIHKGISQAREFDDPPDMQEKTEYLLREWVQLYHSPGSGRDSTKAFTIIVHQMNLQGILKTDDLITRFFRLSTQMCVDLSYRALADPTPGTPTTVRTKCFRTLDAFVRLIALLVKHSGESPYAVSKINLLNKVLGIVTGVLLQDHEVRKTDFQQLPYHRIFIMLLLELNAPETVLEAINFQVLTAFCNVLHILRPEKAPGFAYAWLDIVSHRVFIGRMLAVTPQHKGWGPYAQLLIDLFNFLSPFLRNAELAKPITILYRGCLRVLLVLLHDFPEFLCDYHYNFCDVIPPNCIQLRNLVLSAFPRNLPPPDPFASKLQVDLIPEIREAPKIQTNYASLIQPQSFKTELDTYLSSRAPVTFVTDLRPTLQSGAEPGCRYNMQLINALVLYVGTQAIESIQSKGLQPNKQTITHSSHMDIFQSLAVDLDTEGRYLFLNAIANQLRYPNSHTNYFLHLILYLFAEANTPAIQEQITRVLLERLIVNRPHPWGLLITFIELIKNPTFDFWSHEFVHCAPEIEKLFDSVARSCVAQGQKVAAAAGGRPPSTTPSAGGVVTAAD